MFHCSLFGMLVDQKKTMHLTDRSPAQCSDSTCKIREYTRNKMDEILSSPVTKTFLAGAVSGSLSTILLQPLDLVKTRLQTSVNIGSNVGMMRVAIAVVQKENFFGLWNGLWPSLTRCAPGVGLYFATLHQLRSTFGSSNPKAWESLVLGMSARSIAGILILPITVMKTRYESGAFQYRGLANALAFTYRTEGLRGLYSGLSPTLLRDVPFSGLYLMFYTKLKLHNQPTLFGEGLEPVVDFCNGVMGGALASFVTQPADVIKTSMQIYPEKHKRLKEVIIYIYQERGVYGFWRGIVPRTVRRTLMTALAWTVFEEITRRCNLSSPQ